MVTVYEEIKDKKIVIWGVGIQQTDIRGMYDFPNFQYYIDDDLKEKNLISVSEEEVYSSKMLINADKDMFFIICTEDSDEAIKKLQTLGYDENSYILGAELLINQSKYETIRNKTVAIWGTGNTYSYYENEINEYLPNVESFVVTQKENDNYKGKPLYSWCELEEKGLSKNQYFIITSIYYKEIYELLVGAGLMPGKDFIHIYTMMSLGDLSTRLSSEYKFIDRKKDSKDLLIILAGYKRFVWESVFPRIKCYVPEGMDVCVVTSGLENEELMKMCEDYNWSYMSTKRNHVSLVINLGIWLHPKAEYIYKIDEDIFVTKGVFETLKETYQRVEKESEYEVGFVTPLIPLNGYGYVRALEIFGADKLWEEKFGELKYTDCYHHHKTIHNDPKAASFMWGDNNPNMSSLDAMALYLQKEEFMYSICPVRYSIGFIMFCRNNWLRMGMFPTPEHSNMGSDEIHICKFCFMQSRVMLVAENTIVGHLSYGPQHAEMEKFYNENKRKFLLAEENAE